jgi:hypothetical protein
MRKARDAIQHVGQLNVSTAEMHIIIARLGNRAARSDLLQNNAALRNDRDRRPPVQQNGKETVIGKNGKGNPPNPNARTIVQISEDDPCKRCGMLGTKHGVDTCPFLVQKHPNANNTNKP